MHLHIFQSLSQKLQRLVSKSFRNPDAKKGFFRRPKNLSYINMKGRVIDEETDTFPSSLRFAI